jgi:hypothetical protein
MYIPELALRTADMLSEMTNANTTVSRNAKVVVCVREREREKCWVRDQVPNLYQKPARSGRSHTSEVGDVWVDDDRRKAKKKISEKYLLLRQFVHRVYHKKSTWLEQGIPKWEANV